LYIQGRVFEENVLRTWFPWPHLSDSNARPSCLGKGGQIQIELRSGNEDAPPIAVADGIVVGGGVQVYPDAVRLLTVKLSLLIKRDNLLLVSVQVPPGAVMD
jgi:hypothetical protein